MGRYAEQQDARLQKMFVQKNGDHGAVENSPYWDIDSDDESKHDVDGIVEESKIVDELVLCFGHKETLANRALFFKWCLSANDVDGGMNLFQLLKLLRSEAILPKFVTKQQASHGQERYYLHLSILNTCFVAHFISCS